MLRDARIRRPPLSSSAKRCTRPGRDSRGAGPRPSPHHHQPRRGRAPPRVTRSRLSSERRPCPSSHWVSVREAPPTGISRDRRSQRQCLDPWERAEAPSGAPAGRAQRRVAGRRRWIAAPQKVVHRLDAAVDLARVRKGDQHVGLTLAVPFERIRMNAVDSAPPLARERGPNRVPSGRPRHANGGECGRRLNRGSAGGEPVRDEPAVAVELRSETLSNARRRGLRETIVSTPATGLDHQNAQGQRDGCPQPEESVTPGALPRPHTRTADPRHVPSPPMRADGAAKPGISVREEALGVIEAKPSRGERAPRNGRRARYGFWPRPSELSGPKAGMSADGSPRWLQQPARRLRKYTRCPRVPVWCRPLRTTTPCADITPAYASESGTSGMGSTAPAREPDARTARAMVRDRAAAVSERLDEITQESQFGSAGPRGDARLLEVFQTISRALHARRNPMKQIDVSSFTRRVARPGTNLE